MRKLILYLIFIFSLLLFNYNGNCGSLETKTFNGQNICRTAFIASALQYTVQFDTCTWFLQDCDNDGLPSRRSLDIKLSEKLLPLSSYIEVWSLSATDTIELIDREEIYGDLMEFSMNIPSTDIDENLVIVKLKDISTDEVIDIYTLPGIPEFESDTEDTGSYIGDVFWSDDESTDDDGDHYFSSRKLHLNIRSCPLDKRDYFKISVCKHPVSDEPCWYYISPGFSTAGPQEIILGDINGELDSGIYRIALQVFDEATGETEIEYLNLFDSIKFETNAEDILPEVTFSLPDVFFDENMVDLDKDGYWSRRNLYFDANTDKGTYELWVKVAVKQPGWENYVEYFRSKVFSVTGEEVDYRKVTLGYGNMMWLSHGIYDFKIDLYLGTSLVATKELTDLSGIGQQSAETEDEDPPLKIRELTWVELHDYDLDGKPSYGRLKIDLDVISSVDSAYLAIEGYCGESGEIMAMSDTLDLTVSDTSFYLDVTRTTKCDAMSIEVSLYYTYRLFVITFKEFLPEQNYVFENENEDTQYSLKSVTWGVGTDNDGDGYFSSRTLNVDADAAPFPGSAYLELSACEKPLLAGPCPYIITGIFHPDSTSDDIYPVVIGAPDNEISHGAYNLGFSLLDSVSDNVIGYFIADTNILMEPLSEDLLTYSITEVYFDTNRIDLDGDNYYSSGKLWYSLESSSVGSCIYSIVYYRNCSDTVFNEFFRSEDLDIENLNNDFSLIIDSTVVLLPQNCYDFRIDIHRCADDSLVAFAGPSEFADLKEQNFEKSDEIINNIFNPELPEGISIYPNPVSSVVIIEHDPNRISDLRSFELFDCIGNQVFFDKTKILASRAEYNTEGLKAGIYIVRIRYSGKEIHYKVIKK